MSYSSVAYCTKCGQKYETTGHLCLRGEPFEITRSPNSGWQCPRCNRVYAPHVRECESCNRGMTTGATTT